MARDNTTGTLLGCRPVPDEHGETIARPTEESGPADDFLYHLYRGSELLMDDRVVEAKGELERALSLQPQDAKGQDLLAGVYFRLGLYPRAIEIWVRLVTAYPRDATLRVNLALAMLKTGQPADALDHITTALATAPDHARAWGYLGITYWRLGRYDEARDAFLRGGQASMARRMEDVVAATTLPGAPAPGPVEAPDDEERAAMRTVAEQAIARFEAEQVPLSLAPPGLRKPTGAWRMNEPGEEIVPPRRKPSRTLPAASPSRLGALVDGWSVELPADIPLGIGSNGELFVSAKHDVMCRLDGLRAVRGELSTTALHRRVRGKELPTLLGDPVPVMRWRGPVAAVLAPPSGLVFIAATLADDVLFVRESALFAFDERLGYESGTLPLDDDPVPLTQLHGSGVVIVRAKRPPSAMPVGEGQEVHIVPEALLGWTGRLFPHARGRGGTAPYAATTPPLSFKGEGVVLIA
jgi:uncharacterized protein (AIM24 family)